jgi:hypothetical protein
MRTLSDKYVSACTAHLDEAEFLLVCLLKMRVFSNYSNPRQFKQASLESLTSTHKHVLKRQKLDAGAAAALLVGPLTPKGLRLLCDLYDVSLRVVLGRLYFQCGDAPARCFSPDCEGELQDVGALFELVNPDKPLFAVSYYSKDELVDLAARLDVNPQPKTKVEAYEKVLQKIGCYF